MNILAVETSGELCSVALLRDGAIHVRDIATRQQHGELILPLIQDLLAEARCKPSDLDAVAFGAGPGAFTGVRISCSVAQGIATGLSLPVVPISTLLALTSGTNASQVVAAIDARMGEIYVAAYQQDDKGWQCVVAPTVCRPETAPPLTGSGWVGVGSGFRAYPEQLAERYASALVNVDPNADPRAAQIAKLGAAAFARGEAVPAHLAQPLYVREKVALTSKEQAQLRAESAQVR